MKRAVALFWVSIIAVPFSACAQQGVGLLRFEAEVVDEDGQPVEGAKVDIGGYNPGGESWVANSLTDEEGTIALEISAFYDFGGIVTKDYYYKTNFSQFLGPTSENLVNGCWQPWPIKKTLVLKRKKDPIPMFARHVRSIVPVLDKAVGFDLEEGDWVFPHGTGAVSDFLFTVSGSYRTQTDRDSKLTIRFTNELDGIRAEEVPGRDGRLLGSELRSRHEAPESGYQKNLVQEQRLRPTAEARLNVERKHGQIYYFRVRTKTGPSGDIVSARYGKLYKDFHCTVGEQDDKLLIAVEFTYYFNPDGTRNVEFDPEKNLFPPNPRGHNAARYGTTLVKEP